MKIGITERGDASVDYGWVSKMDSVDGAVLITKNITPKFIDTVLPFKDKVIVHATTTGFGGTVLEPNVPDFKTEIQNMKALMDRGFPANHIVLRIDPIIPTKKGLAAASEVFMQAVKQGLWRVRISVIDMYPHVRDRFTQAGLPLPFKGFQASDEQMLAVNTMVQRWKAACPNAEICCCAESRLKEPIQQGCISPIDLTILGLHNEESSATGFQRKGCLCLSCKTELLTERHQCPHGCLYCYWKDNP